jgi:hypothetical protein
MNCYKIVVLHIFLLLGFQKEKSWIEHNVIKCIYVYCNLCKKESQIYLSHINLYVNIATQLFNKVCDLSFLCYFYSLQSGQMCMKIVLGPVDHQDLNYQTRSTEHQHHRNMQKPPYPVQSNLYSLSRHDTENC